MPRVRLCRVGDFWPGHGWVDARRSRHNRTLVTENTWTPGSRAVSPSACRHAQRAGHAHPRRIPIDGPHGQSGTRAFVRWPRLCRARHDDHRTQQRPSLLTRHNGARSITSEMPRAAFRSNSARAANRCSCSLPLGGGGVDRLAKRVKGDLSPLELGDDVDEVAQAAAETVKPPHHQRVAGAQVVRARLELRALADGA